MKWVILQVSRSSWAFPRMGRAIGKMEGKRDGRCDIFVRQTMSRCHYPLPQCVVTAHAGPVPTAIASCLSSSSPVLAQRAGVRFGGVQGQASICVPWRRGCSLTHVRLSVRPAVPPFCVVVEWNANEWMGERQTCAFCFLTPRHRRKVEAWRRGRNSTKTSSKHGFTARKIIVSHWGPCRRPVCLSPGSQADSGLITPFT